MEQGDAMQGDLINKQMNGQTNLEMQRNGGDPLLDDALIELIWQDLGRRVSHSEVRRKALEVASRYRDARIQLYVPIFIRRQTVEALRAQIASESASERSR